MTSLPLTRPRTTCASLLHELQIVWDEIGESDSEKDKMLLQLEHECLDIYRRKVDYTKKYRADLHQLLADADSEITKLVSSLGEPASFYRKGKGTLKEQISDVKPFLEELKLKKQERLKEFYDTHKQIAWISTEIAGSDGSVKSAEPQVDEHDLTLKRLGELKLHLKELQNEKSLRLQKVISYTSMIHELPKFNLRNGDPSNVASILMKTTIGAAYHWVPVGDLHPEDAMEAMDAFILSHLAHLSANRPTNMTNAQLRKVAICLGVARAVSTTLFELQPQDLMAGERTAPLLRASRNADGNLVYVIVQGITAEQTTLLNSQMVFTEVERQAICQLVKCGAGILPMQGYSLIMTMHQHHYLSSAPQSRKVYQVAEKAYWYGQDVSMWFTTDIAVIQDALWHKAGHPVRLDLKTRLAMDPSIGTVLVNAGAGACASRLPAVELELRTANTYLTLVATVNPLFSMIGGNVDSSALAAMVEIVKAYPVNVTDVAVQPVLPEDLVGIVVNRATALLYLSSMLKRNQDIVAYCYGFYNALSESSLMVGAGAGAQADTLKTSYSLTKLKTQSHAAYIEGYQSYGDYAAVRNMR